MQFSPTPAASSLLGFHILLSTLFTASTYPFLSVRDKVSVQN
jgi:hypothetical protein